MWGHSLARLGTGSAHSVLCGGERLRLCACPLGRLGSPSSVSSSAASGQLMGDPPDCVRHRGCRQSLLGPELQTSHAIARTHAMPCHDWLAAGWLSQLASSGAHGATGTGAWCLVVQYVVIVVRALGHERQATSHEPADGPETKRRLPDSVMFPPGPLALERQGTLGPRPQGPRRSQRVTPRLRRRLPSAPLRALQTCSVDA